MTRRRYFGETLEHCNIEDFLVYRAGVLDDVGEVPICCNAAAPSTWQEVLDGVRDQADVGEVLRDWWSETNDYQNIGKGDGWRTDQVKLFHHLERWEGAGGNGRVRRLTDRDTMFRRLDRSSPTNFRRKLCRRLYLLRSGFYSDYHAMRPPSVYDELNRQIASEAMRPASRVDRLRTALKRQARN